MTTAKPRDRDTMLNMLIKLFINSICSFIASLTTEKPLDLNPLYSSSIHQSSIFCLLQPTPSDLVHRLAP